MKKISMTKERSDVFFGKQQRTEMKKEFAYFLLLHRCSVNTAKYVLALFSGVLSIA
jgi:hypothetical protein